VARPTTIYLISRWPKSWPSLTLPITTNNVDRVAARYDQIFVPPFSPWNTSAATGTTVSGPGDLLKAGTDPEGDEAGRSSALRQESSDSISTGPSWVRPPELSSTTEMERCRLNLVPGGGCWGPAWPKGVLELMGNHRHDAKPRSQERSSSTCCDDLVPTLKIYR